MSGASGWAFAGAFAVGRRTAAAQKAYRDRLREHRERAKVAAELASPQPLLPLVPEVQGELAKPENLPWHGRREAKWRDTLIRLYGNPIVAMMKIAAMPTAELAERLDCSMEAAFDRQVDCMKWCSGFTVPKAPAELTVEGSGGGGGFAINIKLGAEPEPMGDLLEGTAEEVDDAA